MRGWKMISEFKSYLILNVHTEMYRINMFQAETKGFGHLRLQSPYKKRAAP